MNPSTQLAAQEILEVLDAWTAVGQLALAAVLGAIVGAEREWNGHPAGLRTNLLIAISSCLFTILSINGFPLRGAAQDTARIAAQIVTGVGFLGAGALIQTRTGTKGMTTAATIWLVAAIGMAIGAGQYVLGVFTALFSTAALVLLVPVGHWLGRTGGKSRQTSDDV